MEMIKDMYELADLWDRLTAGVFDPADKPLDEPFMDSCRWLLKKNPKPYWTDVISAAVKDEDALGKTGFPKATFRRFMTQRGLRIYIGSRAGIKPENYIVKAPSGFGDPIGDVGFEKSRADLLLESHSLGEDDFLAGIGELEKNWGKAYNDTNKKMLYKHLYPLTKGEYRHLVGLLPTKYEWLPKVNQILDTARPYLVAAVDKRRKMLKEILEAKAVDKCDLCRNEGYLIAVRKNEVNGLSYESLFNCECDFGEMAPYSWPAWKWEYIDQGYNPKATIYKKQSTNNSLEACPVLQQ